MHACGSRREGLFEWAVCLGLACLLAAAARAHESPEHVVEELSRTMRQDGPTPELLYQRATEYRALQRWRPAAKDLEAALVLDPSFVVARCDLARVFLAQGKPNRALTTMEEAVRRVPGEAARAPLYLVRAEIYRAQGRLDLALADAERALRSPEAPPEWYLMRSQLLCRAGRAEEALGGLRAGFERTGSYVLEEEWIDVLLAAGRFELALEQIEPHLEAARWRAAWWVRRAQAWQGSQQQARAAQDAKAALAEIEQRFNPERPDVTLLIDRGLAHLVLGDRKGAERELRRALKLGADAGLTWRLESALERNQDQRRTVPSKERPATRPRVSR